MHQPYGDNVMGRGRRRGAEGGAGRKGKVVKLCKCPDIDNDIDYNALSLARIFSCWYVRKKPMMNPNVV